MLGDPATDVHPISTIDKAFEGNDAFDYLHCYVADPPAKGQASIDIEPSQVYQIQLLNRLEDCCSKQTIFLSLKN